MADPGVAAALARGSVGFTRLHISYMIDARDFFMAYRKGWEWQHLASLPPCSLPIQAMIRSVRFYVQLARLPLVCRSCSHLHYKMDKRVSQQASSIARETRL
ncbi:uncharacterized protein BKA55DRAFT_552058 [Fusarium redolens]|uniref:DUF6546 domain-containing protein n=1 Tax=Fusarium redolens TaxID=48865 RepID=A0A9P9KY90_FUSRE|nr:uncharacterized protein BKA55DRAFT_552058 [Fusarium redolens]KAH7270558.1 hypothetical protein BKA55DRAFT_552058 [Fusarium redolens]